MIYAPKVLVTRLVIGSSWNGWISQIKAFGSVISDAQLQALST